MLLSLGVVVAMGIPPRTELPRLLLEFQVLVAAALGAALAIRESQETAVLGEALAVTRLVLH
jgi:hypothetical protein